MIHGRSHGAGRRVHGFADQDQYAGEFHHFVRAELGDGRAADGDPKLLGPIHVLHREVHVAHRDAHTTWVGELSPCNRCGQYCDKPQNPENTNHLLHVFLQ